MTEFEPGSLLRRYQAGEHEAVWADMVALGAAVRKAPYADDAWAVARETMRRARHNIEVIIRRLDQLGYQFWDGQPQGLSFPMRMAFEGKVVEYPSPEAMMEQLLKQDISRVPAPVRQSIENMRDMIAKTGGLMDRYRDRQKELAEARQRKSEITDHLTDAHVFSPPTEDGVAWIRELEEKGLILPLSLRAWAEEVGDVSLAGAHPRLCFWEGKTFPGVYADPLMVTLDHLDFQAEGWLEEHEADGDADDLEVVLGWDAEAKARLAVEDELLDYGYTVDLPNAAADIVLAGEPHDTTFVNYLRIAFSWGGFPGWEQQQKRPEQELKLLTDGLLPI